jgi:hypothetical protein
LRVPDYQESENVARVVVLGYLSAVEYF